VSDLVVSRHEAVVRIVLNRPGKLNSITDAMWAQLGAELARVRASEEDRAVLLCGAGGVFSAGSDVTGFIGHQEPLADRIERCNQVLLDLHDLPVPTVAKVDGDFVIASDRSRFAELFTHIGLSLDTGSSWLLPRLVGERRARELALLGDWVDAGTAVTWGLVNAAVPQNRLDDECEALLARLVALSAAASAGTKRLLNDSWHSTLREALTAETVNQLDVIETSAARAMIQAFLTKTERKAST
jgi:enoyl-CoA hydratase/carnithine racemase